MKRFSIFRYLVVNLLFLPIASYAQHREEKSIVRQPAVAGSFYPSDPVKLKAQLSDLFQSAEIKPIDGTIAALISPHAGYFFSGEVATSAYSQLDPDKGYQTIFLLGTSHHVRLNGASIYNQGNYKTPLGIVEVDTDLADKLIAKNSFFEFDPAAHSKEHSIEVQLPFLQYHLKKPFKLVPIIIGTQSTSTCKKIAEALKPYFNDQNLFVISSDFSHYPSYNGALEADRNTQKAIETDSPETFLKAIQSNETKNIPGLVTSACGWSSILTLLDMSSKTSGIEIRHIKYQNSGDTQYGDKQRVVGYHAFTFSRTKASSKSIGFSLTTEDKIELVELARKSIESKLQSDKLPPVNEDLLSDALKTPCGAFVTLHKDGKLRGCIGQFMPSQPLYQVVRKMAIAAAFQDYRFDPVSTDELKNIDLEISVLTPLKTINNIDEIELGKHGIYIVKGNRKGTFLPQVAHETQWSKEEFLGHCARDKAGIGWNGWRDAELYTYEALIFSERELLLPKL